MIKLERMGKKYPFQLSGGQQQRVALAKLTGCKNFSSARYLSQDELEAVDWGVKLKARDSITKELGHVGMRANYIRLAAEKDKDNVFACWPSFTSETPFMMTVYLSLGKKPSGPGDYHLLWEVSKEKWFELQGCPLPWNICLNPEKLMFFER